MRADDTGHMGLSRGLFSQSSAILLGVCSLGTQTVFLRLVLSSQSGGEVYAALALGGWIAAAGIGAFLARNLDAKYIGAVWSISSIIKLPLAAVVIVYPALYSQLLDPIRFLPLIFAAIVPTGILYGAVFSFLISTESRIASIYGFEAMGSIAGGLMATIWAGIGLSDLGFLLLLSGIELGLAVGKKACLWALPVLGLILGIVFSPTLEHALAEIRWRGFDIAGISHGLSGTWTRLERQDQVTIVHNGNQIGSIPDRPTAEEAIYWPLLYHPNPQNMLLIGYEGIPVSTYAPREIEITRLLFDKAYLKMNIPDSSRYVLSDPLAFSHGEFDIISIRLYGAASLSDYRYETERLFKHCRDHLANGGLLFVSAPSDENYISPQLGLYLSSLFTTLKNLFGNVLPIGSTRMGFICWPGRTTENAPDTIDMDISKLGIESPYFTEALISNVLSPVKAQYLARTLIERTGKNNIANPGSVLHYLLWQSSQLGFQNRQFIIVAVISAALGLLALVFLPIGLGRLAQISMIAIICVFLFGALGMMFELLALYLFQILLGALYLYLGLLIALFMAGMSWGTVAKSKISFIHLLLPYLSAATLVGVILLWGHSGMSLPFLAGLLYLAAVISGYATGAGFALVTNRSGRERASGSVLYGADLFGALAGVLVTPFILLNFGATFLLSIMVVISIMSWVLFKMRQE